MKNTKKLGFTLVELIVVITILSILGTIAFLSFQGYSSDARDSVRLSDIKNIETGLELFSIKTGKYPEPDNSTSYTGSNNEILFNQGDFGENLTRMININKTPLDPITGNKYTYSSTKEGGYYNISTIKETSIANNIINKTYADNELSILRGNYRMDPSLPSLIIVPSSVTTGSGIFDPSVCFVVNLGRNTVNKCVEKKSEMSLKKYEPNLVAYYDMETYYQTTYSSTPNVVFLKDLSGNNYDLYGTGGLGLLTSIETSSGSIFSSGGIIFDYDNFHNSFGTLSSSIGNINSVDKDIFVKNMTSSGGEIIPGLSFKIYLDYDLSEHNINLALNYIKKTLFFSKTNKDSKDSGDFLKGINFNFFNFNSGAIQSFYRPFNDGLSSAQSIYGVNGCGNNNDELSIDDDTCFNDNIINPNHNTSLNGKGIFYVIYNFNHKKQYVYGNGKLLYSINIGNDEITRIQENGYKSAHFSISPFTQGFIGKIYEIALYDRALGEKEITQQTKISGF